MAILGVKYGGGTQFETDPIWSGYGGTVDADGFLIIEDASAGSFDPSTHMAKFANKCARQHKFIVFEHNLLKIPFFILKSVIH